MSLFASPGYAELARGAGADSLIQKGDLFVELARYLYATFGGEAAWQSTPTGLSSPG